MSDTKAGPGSRHPLTWAVVTVLIIVPFVALLWVPYYARAAPKAGGFPFFYWYQLVWIPAVAILATIAFLLLARTRTRRGGSGDREPGGDDDGQSPPGGWYGKPPGNAPGQAGGTQPGRGAGYGTEGTS